MTKHISKQVFDLLADEGWQIGARDGLPIARKRIERFEEAGTVSNGARVVSLTICDRGRYLSRVDGWGATIADVDLRDYPHNPAAAIEKVLS